MLRLYRVVLPLALSTAALAQEFPGPADLGRLPGERAPAPPPEPTPPAPPPEPPAPAPEPPASEPPLAVPEPVDAPAEAPKHPAEGEIARIPEDWAAIGAKVREGLAAAEDPLRTLQGPHGADAPARVPRGDRLDVSGEARLRVTGWTDPVLDDAGTRSGRGWWLSSRLIVGATWRQSERATLELELEALNGPIAGPFTTVGTELGTQVLRLDRSSRSDLGRILPRKLALAVLFPNAGQLRVGVQTFQWGLGMLANDGRQDVDFGDPDTGNVVARALFATQPWRNAAGDNAAKGLTIFAAADLVLRDDNADVFRGDLAASGIVGARLAHPRAEAGVFGVARWQRDRVDPFDPRPTRTTTLVFPVDGYVRALLTPVGASHRVVLEAEGAVVAGHTTRPYGDETVSGSAVRSYGVLGRLRVDSDPLRLTAKLEAGLASGDDDLRDGVSRTFAFHTDHQVGLLLFDQLLPLVTARSVDRAGDPDLVGTPSPGLRYTVQQGAVSNAAYLFPVLRVRPVAGLDLRAGWVAAWTAGHLVDPYRTGLAGGWPTTPGGAQPGRRFLGHEVDLSARYHVALPRALRLELGVEGASFVPGAAFDGLDGDRLRTQWLGRGRVTFGW